ncbi:MAG TPA: cisplatin damage response ATP-dependent DNA ligase [Stellaceae bacterium]|nr:cisplatin damage response ATP-dependent DNA ligase [Stellaceae bacterium]
MKRFAELLDALLFTPARGGKIRLLTDYFATVPDPDRGWALAALTESLDLAAVKPAQIRALAAARVDAELFEWSYDFVGDLAETVSLIWPVERPSTNAMPRLSEVVERLQKSDRRAAPELIARWLDELDSEGRWALLKLVTGGLRVGVSARLAKTALAEWSGKPLERIEELWHGIEPPYRSLFAWLEDKGREPSAAERPIFSPLMLAIALEEAELAEMDPGAFVAEWKWDGIRVQLVARGGERRLYSRAGDEIGSAFPEIVGAIEDEVTLDGELLILRDGAVAPFNDLQQRLNRKQATPKLIEQYPAAVRLYDLLHLGERDLRPLPLRERRASLETWYRLAPRPRLDLSPLIPFAGWEELRVLRAGARERGIEGLMLKRADSPYLAGRPKGPWFKWKRDALTADCVLMYAQRGHGKRSSFYSDFTFGAWREGALVPVGKAYFGFTDEELVQLDRWVRAHTRERYGPVREVEPALVLEVAFDSVHRSSRHKSGLALRFPRIARIRWDKPAGEADEVENLAKLAI